VSASYSPDVWIWSTEGNRPARTAWAGRRCDVAARFGSGHELVVAPLPAEQIPTALRMTVARGRREAPGSVL
jgi:hypothetical protein